VAPLIVFLHGWGATNPAVYGAWIDHLVKMGNIVVYPRYQKDFRTPTSDFLAHTLGAVHDAIRILANEPGHTRPNLRKVGIVGHSVGGLLAANVAAVATDSGLPSVGALMSVQPGRTWNRLPRTNVALEDLRKIPGKTLLLAVAGDQDRLAGDTDAKRIYYESKQVSAASKDFVRLVSDDHGWPVLIANHLAPAAPDPNYDDGEGTQANGGEGLRGRVGARGKQSRQNQSASTGQEENLPLVYLPHWEALEARVDALDYYGLWKLFDALCDAAFYGRNRRFALGNTLQQRFMGFWSDGRVVKQLFVTDTP
jgi:pimeloyl-ACP methyl ester carboxylesterase